MSALGSLSADDAELPIVRPVQQAPDRVAVKVPRANPVQNTRVPDPSGRPRYFFI